jgi:peroxiredoxin Q/BCP
MKEKSMYGKTFLGIERMTFLIDKAGIIRRIWRKVTVADHAADVLEYVKQL